MECFTKASGCDKQPEEAGQDAGPAMYKKFAQEAKRGGRSAGGADHQAAVLGPTVMLPFKSLAIVLKNWFKTVKKQGRSKKVCASSEFSVSLSVSCTCQAIQKEIDKCLATCPEYRGNEEKEMTFEETCAFFKPLAYLELDKHKECLAVALVVPEQIDLQAEATATCA